MERGDKIVSCLVTYFKL